MKTSYNLVVNWISFQADAKILRLNCNCLFTCWHQSFEVCFKRNVRMNLVKSFFNLNQIDLIAHLSLKVFLFGQYSNFFSALENRILYPRLFLFVFVSNGNKFFPLCGSFSLWFSLENNFGLGLNSLNVLWINYAKIFPWVFHNSF